MIALFCHLVSDRHHGGHNGEQQSDHVLANQSEGNSQTDSSGGVQAGSNGEDNSHDAADNSVGGLSAANRHVTDGHQLVGTADNQASGQIAQDRTDDSTGNDRLIQGFQEIKLIDGDDEHPHKDQNDLNSTKAHSEILLLNFFRLTVRAYLNSFSMLSEAS